ncbi:MAG: hypothetical protein ACFCU1_11810 [Sumerlaeia bacterium]
MFNDDADFHSSNRRLRINPLEIKQMADFDSSLGNVDFDERKSKRILYFKQALIGQRTLRNIFTAFTIVSLIFAIIPCFWPVLLYFFYLKKTLLKANASITLLALEYWNLHPEDVGLEPADVAGVQKAR